MYIVKFETFFEVKFSQIVQFCIRLNVRFCFCFRRPLDVLRHNNHKHSHTYCIGNSLATSFFDLALLGLFTFPLTRGASPTLSFKSLKRNDKEELSEKLTSIGAEKERLPSLKNLVEESS